MPKLVYVGFCFAHHKNTHAGYHQIKDKLKYNYVIDCQSYFDKKTNPSQNIFAKIYRKIAIKVFGEWLFPLYLLQCIWLGICHDDLVFHFIYGENLYIPFKRFIRKGNKVVCTLHQPMEWFLKRKKWMYALSTLDAIILVGSSELEDFKKIVGIRYIKYIPHGIFTDFYIPNLEVKKKQMLLTVGNWLRDFNFANRVYKRLLDQNKDFCIAVVSNIENLKKIDRHERIFFSSGITDAELLLLYQQASVLFLPLIRYTANNSLLEAASCGCNIVISSNFPDNSYIPEQYLTLLPMEEDLVVQAVMEASKFSYNMPLASYVKNNYSWDEIGKQTLAFLKSL